jgi:hypothetical protein
VLTQGNEETCLQGLHAAGCWPPTWRILDRAICTRQSSRLFRRPNSPTSFSSPSRRSFSKGRRGFLNVFPSAAQHSHQAFRRCACHPLLSQQCWRCSDTQVISLQACNTTLCHKWQLALYSKMVRNGSDRIIGAHNCGSTLWSASWLSRTPTRLRSLPQSPCKLAGGWEAHVVAGVASCEARAVRSSMLGDRQVPSTRDVKINSTKAAVEMASMTSTGRQCTFMLNGPRAPRRAMRSVVRCRADVSNRDAQTTSTRDSAPAESSGRDAQQRSEFLPGGRPKDLKVRLN